MTGAVRIGVTGHRWFDDVEGVTARIDDVLARAAGAGPDARRLEVWSALAEGADRLVVDRAFLFPSTRLIALLPLSPDDYEADFGDAASLREFRDLLASATETQVVGPDASGSRTSAYERAGFALVDAVDVLVAVWDGEAARGRGGTGAVVARAEDDPHTRVEIVPVTRAEAAP